MPKKTTEASVATPTRKIAVFPGQFDPITLGHLDIIQRGSVLFDQVIVAVGVNPEKRELFTHEHRLKLIHELLEQNELSNVRAELYTGLTADFVRASKATAEAVEDLGLVPGMVATASVKATSVVVEVPEP